MIYVTFCIPQLIREDTKIAVKCQTEGQAIEVAQDAYSLAGIKNIRLRKCGRPRKGRRIVAYEEYYKYHMWY